MTVFTVVGCVVQAAEGPPLTWRTPENGGVNALYCYLRANAVDCDYRTLLDAQKRYGVAGSARSLELIADAAGLTLQTDSLTWDELKRCSWPVIVHTDGDTTEAGVFILVMNIARGNVYFMNGPTATVGQMSEESFRRTWSSNVLLPADGRWRNCWQILVGLCLGAMLPLALTRLRRRPA